MPNETLPAIRYGRYSRPKRSLSLSWGLTFCTVCCLLFVTPLMHPQEETEIRYRTEANFLAHFASFVEWPPSAFADERAPLRLCMFGNAEFANSILSLTNDLKPHGRHIE